MTILRIRGTILQAGGGSGEARASGGGPIRGAEVSTGGARARSSAGQQGRARRADRSTSAQRREPRSGSGGLPLPLFVTDRALLRRHRSVLLCHRPGQQGSATREGALPVRRGPLFAHLGWASRGGQ